MELCVRTDVVRIVVTPLPVITRQDDARTDVQMVGLEINAPKVRNIDTSRKKGYHCGRKTGKFIFNLK